MEVRIVLGAFAALFLSISVTFACSCVSSFGCPGLGGPAYPVFVGTVLQVIDLPPTNTFSFLSSRKARIRVSESFGGLASDVAEIDVLTGMGGGDCGIPFKSGETYVVHGFVAKDGLVHAGICSSTRRIDEAGAALRILRARRAGQKVPSLAGQIVQRDRNFDGLLGVEAPKALPNALVRVRSQGRSYETYANAEGLYAFYDLPGGRYEFAPDLPQGTYSGSEGEMLRKGFPQSSRPRLVKKPAVSVVQPYIRLHRVQGAYRYESQSQTFDVRG